MTKETNAIVIIKLEMIALKLKTQASIPRRELRDIANVLLWCRDQLKEPLP